MRLSLILTAVGLFIFAGCNNAPEHPANAPAGPDTANTATRLQHAQSVLSDDGTQLLVSLVSEYYALKNALVGANPGDAATASAKLSDIADKVNNYLQKDTTKIALKPFLDTIRMESKVVNAIKDETCEKQRLAFGPLSGAMFGLLKAVALTHVTVYREYCPMAFNEKGATWLSDDPDIKNPYFGKKMLECGEVTDSLK